MWRGAVFLCENQMCAVLFIYILWTAAKRERERYMTSCMIMSHNGSMFWIVDQKKRQIDLGISDHNEDTFLLWLYGSSVSGEAKCSKLVVCSKYTDELSSASLQKYVLRVIKIVVWCDAEGKPLGNKLYRSLWMIRGDEVGHAHFSVTLGRKERSPVVCLTLPGRRDGGVLPWRKTTCQGQFETCLHGRQAPSVSSPMGSVETEEGHHH